MDVQGWKDSLAEYEQEKKKVPEMAKTARTNFVSILQGECPYNPILQTYKDPVIEKNLREIEKKRMTETLAKNQDRALRYEQTFNLVNLENKLKGLEGLPGYPVEKLPNYKNRRLGNTSNTEYNIISNQDFADHHFLPPESRPPRPATKVKTYKIHTVEYRDYNVLTNRYFQEHDKKIKLDNESYRQEAAAAYWKSRDFDPIKCTFVDEVKEKDYWDSVKEKEKNHGLEYIEKLPHGIKYSEGALYQPIGMKVVDKKRLEEIDLREKNAKKRYENRYDIEKDYRVKDIVEQDLKKSASLNRISHERFLETTNRGYNIISHAPFQGLGAEKLHLPRTNPKVSVWDKAVGEAQTYTALPEKQTSMKTLRSRGFLSK